MEKILIVDDLKTQRLKYETIVKKSIENCQIFMADNGKDALKIIRKEFDVSIVILDIDFSTLPKEKIISSDSHREGYIIAQMLREVNPDLQIILTTCFDEIDEPFVIRLDDTFSDIKQKIKLAFRVAQLERENRELRRQLYAVKTDKVTIVGKSTNLMQVLEQAKRAAIGDDKESILIMGERGTGKELLAKFIHYHSTRREKPFIVINCAAIPENLIESELFGTEKGAFTGAERKIGKIELANNGILFLDEVGDMGALMQTKLLRVLEYRTFEKLGGVKTIKPDVRFIFASNKNLPNEIDAGRFREDLYDRMGALHLYMPPLRARRDDIPLLVTYFINKLPQNERKPKGISPELMELFMSYHWPGNVRQLERVVRGMAIMSSNEILDFPDLPENIRKELQVDHVKNNGFEKIEEQLSCFPETEKIRLLQLFAQTADTVNRDKVKIVLGLGDTATNERVQMLKQLGLIQMDSRKYRKTELLEKYWKWLNRNE